jgi:hypothetical protein
MTDRDDVWMSRIARLPTIEPDPLHAARVRAGCHRLMERRTRRAARRAQKGGWARAIEMPLAAAFCVGYLAAVIYDVARLYSVLRALG